MAINLKSIFNMTKQVIKPMMKSRKGSIINMSSIVGVRGNAGQSSYAASKARNYWFYKIDGAGIRKPEYSLQCNSPGIY